jgi:hypothetical protein
MLGYRLTRYFGAHYKALSRETEKADNSGTNPDSIPHYYRGHKKEAAVRPVACLENMPTDAWHQNAQTPEHGRFNTSETSELHIIGLLGY